MSRKEKMKRVKLIEDIITAYWYDIVDAGGSELQARGYLKHLSTRKLEAMLYA